jgi:hypothetical protein
VDAEEAAIDEHERTVRAARQVDIRIGFYIHFAVFLLVCIGLVAVNWLMTPEVWWAQWPFLAWGIGVLGHALQKPHDVRFARVDLEAIDLDLKFFRGKAPLDLCPTEFCRHARLCPQTHPAPLLGLAVSRSIDRHGCQPISFSTPAKV